MEDEHRIGANTLAVQGEHYHGQRPGPLPLATPIYVSATYRLPSAKHGAELSVKGHCLDGVDLPPESSQYLYSRWANPTTDAAADVINALEGGKKTYMFASGMAAISTALFSVLKAGDHCIAQTPIYGGSHEIFDLLATYGVEVSRVELPADGNADGFREKVKENTKLVYCESPANPICGLLDLEAIKTLCTEKGIISVVDSTFASPINQQPIKIGFDMVVHSCTKYIAGHSDVTAGAVVCANNDIAKQIWHGRKLFGGILSPYEAFLILRGVKTLKLRVDAQNANALFIAQWLETRPEVSKVFYPGLPSHPAYKIAKTQMSGFGGMIAFELKDGASAGQLLVENVKIINHAVSLGGVESLITHPVSTTHIMVPESVRLAGGVTDGLIRLSVGIEDKEDLQHDLKRCLDLITASQKQ
eukprot:TRINITY_DN5215_c0_g1_i1.p1 TRINITY_DN5215_c0_g1~~TRINITY_DN5215_c0_g1_i1.p1  ORF type:complete len:417 (+),score=58.96 TRINITY_DN5215_c0_g1_i1:27-1277(+)